MPRLSNHFREEEFKCPCCDKAEVQTALIDALEELRSALGKPVNITSGYRCPHHNRAVGGAAKSQHMLGTAADVWVQGISPQQLARFAESHVAAFEQGGIGVYPCFTHLDVRGRRVRWKGSRTKS